MCESALETGPVCGLEREVVPFRGEKRQARKQTTVGLSGAPVAAKSFLHPREDRNGSRQSEGSRGQGDYLFNLLSGNPRGQSLTHVGVDGPFALTHVGVAGAFPA